MGDSNFQSDVSPMTWQELNDFCYTIYESALASGMDVFQYEVVFSLKYGRPAGSEMQVDNVTIDHEQRKVILSE